MNLLSKIYKKFLHRYKKKINLDKTKIKLIKLDDIFNFYETDKGSKLLNPYSKLKKRHLIKGHGFAKFYEKHFKSLKKRNINILEIGIWKGASTASFFHYFKKAQFFAIDRNFKLKYSSKRINFFFCDTTSPKDLSKFKTYIESKKVSFFDIIIDDGSHILSNILKNLIFFFKYLIPGGIYVIEDYKHPNYFTYLHDVKNHIFIDKVLFYLRKKALILSYYYINYRKYQFLCKIFFDQNLYLILLERVFLIHIILLNSLNM